MTTYISIKDAVPILHMSEKGLQKHVVSSSSQIRSVRQGIRRMLDRDDVYALAIKRGYDVPPINDDISADDAQTLYIPAQEAADILQTSANNLHQMVTRPNPSIRSTKQDGRRLFLRSDVLRYQEQRKHPSASRSKQQVEDSMHLVDANAPYINVHEAAAILGISTASVWRRTHNPNWKVQVQRNGRNVSFHRGDVEALAQGIPSSDAHVELAAPSQATDTEFTPFILPSVEYDLQAHLLAAYERIGELQAQLATRLTPEDERLLRDEVVAYRTRLEAQLAPLSIEAQPRVKKNKKKKSKKS